MKTKKTTEQRTCFNCYHCNICYVFDAMAHKTCNNKFNMDTDDLPGKWKDIFLAIGNACFSFELKKLKK